MSQLNETHDPGLTSWVESANGHSDFSIQNLPFAVFRRRESAEEFRGGVAIGDCIVDMTWVAQEGRLDGVASRAANAAAGPTLNKLMSMGPSAWAALRLALSRALRTGSKLQQSWSKALVPQDAVEFRVAADVGDYTDFYTSIHHATTVGRLFRPDNPLLPNYQWVPIGYHGRSSTLGVSGQSFRRPKGQVLAVGEAIPKLTPSLRMDYELELGVFIGNGNDGGGPISIEVAEEHIFGICLLNDWSARDIQSWEYQPLGPFLSKNFATTLSPWIVTSEALVPFRCAWHRPAEDPQPLEYLDSPGNRNSGAIDISLEVEIETPLMRAAGEGGTIVCRTNFRHAYWTIAQMVSHHTVNGCRLRPGDLLGTGTQSGPGEKEAGSLLELTQGGKRPLQLRDGESRTFLEDGDSVVFRGWCEQLGFARIGFGDVRGTLLAA